MLKELRAKLARRWERFTSLVLHQAPEVLLHDELRGIQPAVAELIEVYGRDRWFADLDGDDEEFEAEFEKFLGDPAAQELA